MGLLADIYSAGDGLKRKVGGLLSDPMGTIDLAVSRIKEDNNNALNLFSNAFPMAGENTVLNSPEQIAQLQKQAAEYASQVGMAAATVWHGSPHKFDKFDSSKIGTGEGAQAYGHGLYLAESPDVAKRYKPNIPRPHVDGVDAATLGQPLWEVSDTMASRGFGVDEYKQFQKTYRESQIESALKAGNARKAELLKESLDEELKIADGLRGKNISRDTGSLYKVDLPDEHIAKMLDWDKPLSQQHPDVQKAISKYATANVPAEGLDMGGGRILANHNGQAKPDSFSPWVLKAGDSLFDISQKDMDRMLLADKGEAAYTRMTAALGAQGKASDALRQAGIPGIRYLDGGSRGAGQGSSNFVVFPGNEGLLQILERNGQPIGGR